MQVICIVTVIGMPWAKSPVLWSMLRVLMTLNPFFPASARALHHP